MVKLSVFEVCRESAYAKINLHLNVLPRREDGYHDIESVFIKVNLCDDLLVTKNDKPGCVVLCSNMNLPKENTITRAYDVFCAKTGVHCGVEVRLEKRIPSQAGLGGGSSDGAAMLRVLNSLFKTNLSQQDFAEMALSIGSDVPFFVYNFKFAIITGRGEVIQPLSQGRDLHFVIVLCNEGVSTLEAYTTFDKVPLRNCALSLRSLKNEFENEPRNWRFSNSFLPIVEQKVPQVRKNIAMLLDYDAEFACMSGSGSACFGVFSTAQQAKNVTKTFLDQGINAVYAG